MGDSLDELINRARSVTMTPAQAAEQRISFAYGTAKIENENISRETVLAAAKLITREKDNTR